MRVKIEYECVDKHSGERYEKGQRLNVDKERGEELIAAGHYEIVLRKRKKRRKPKAAPENKRVKGAPGNKG